MSVSMVNAVLAVRPLPALSSADAGAQARVGDLLQLAVAAAKQGELAAVAESGLNLALPAGSAAPGDLLTVRVLAVSPRLELQIVERRPAAEPTPERDMLDSPALRLDPAWFARQRGLAALAPDAPASLASQWRTLVLAAAVRPPVAEGGATPTSWPLQLPAWPGQFVLMRMLLQHEPGEREPAEGEGASATLQNGGAQLCLRLHVGGVPVELLLRWEVGVWIKVVAADPAVRALVQACLPGLASALAVVPIKLRGCQVGAWRTPQRELGPGRWKAALAGASGVALLRAAAEFVKLIHGLHPSEPTTAISR